MMEFIDLKTQQRKIRDKLISRITRVLDHGSYIMGPEIRELEEKLAGFVGVKHGIACSSGTDALLLALLAYHVKPGDAVFTTPFTFIATAEVVSLIGAVPVFVDIDPKTYNLDPEKLEQAIISVKHRTGRYASSSLNPKGIIAVDLFGLPADYDRINAIAQQHGLFVIEDAAQSFGAELREKRAGSLAEIGCTSFFPAKPLGCYGDGGMCFTNDDSLADAMRSFAVHGQGRHKYENVRIGINGRLDTLQAAVLLEKFAIFPEEIELRQEVANRYQTLLSSCPTVTVTIPFIPPQAKSIWAQYSLLAQHTQHRTTLMELLKKEGIPTAIYYPKPLHLQDAFSYLGYTNGDLPISELISERIFSLPMHPYLDAASQEKIVRVLTENPL